MLNYLIRYLSSSNPDRLTSPVSGTAFVQAIAGKLEKDVNSLQSKGRGVCTFKALFYSRILVSLWEHIDCINDGRPYTGELLPLPDILNLLERLCQWPDQSAQAYESTAHLDAHRYTVLNKLLSSQTSALPAILEFIKAKSCWEENALNLWRDLFEHSLEPVAKGKGPDTAELKRAEVRSTIQDVHEDICKLHNALTQHLGSDSCRCSRRSMVVNLESEQFCSRIGDFGNPLHFRLFLTNSHVNEYPQPVYWWQDVQIHIDKQRLVHFKDPESTDGSVTAQKSFSAAQHIPGADLDIYSHTGVSNDDDLCSLFDSRILFQHYLVYSSCFKRLSAGRPSTKFRQDHPSIPLSELIGYGKLTTKMKIFLSSCLVQTVWQLYNSGWIREDWSKHDIHFMLERDEEGIKVSTHEPFLQTCFNGSGTHNRSIPKSRTMAPHGIRPHRYPNLLALGIMLLEIELDQAIENLVQLDFHDPDPINTKHTMAISVLGNKRLWPPREIYSFLKETIEVCVAPDYDRLEKTNDVRHNFLEEVVQPFTNFLVEAWPKDQKTFPLSLDTGSKLPHKPKELRTSPRTQLPIAQPLAEAIIHSNEDYTVGWIAALEIEMAVARGMLDEVHTPLYQIEGDTNNYILGRLGSHKVVIACLPSMGNNNAALVAANLLRSFHNIRIGLMVGVGGGVPAANDMRLGDVVVSSPTGTHGGVIQYDFGTATQTVESFVRKGHLNQPPTAILTAIKTIRANALLQEYEFGKYFAAMIRKYPNIGEQCKRPKEDQLYHTEHLHKTKDLNCDQCGNEGLVHREPRSITKVHYGTIGSGNEVIRDANLRDYLHEKENIICFEMEAAGIMNDFPCIVIRGICDYCDTHKAKEWQPYAAGIAAAFAKELLLTISPTHVGATTIASNTLVA